jgi:hypothetical protein
MHRQSVCLVQAGKHDCQFTIVQFLNGNIYVRFGDHGIIAAGPEAKYLVPVSLYVVSRGGFQDVV